MDSGQIHKIVFHRHKNIVHERKRNWSANTKETYATHKTKVHQIKQQRTMTKNGRIMLIAGIVLTSILAMMIVTWFTLGMIYKNKILPGVRLAGLVISDDTLNAEELNDMALRQASKALITLQYKETEMVANLANIGATIDAEATIEAVWQAKRQGNIFAKYNPAVIENVSLVVNIDEQIFQRFLDEKFGEWTENMVETQLIYNDETKSFDVMLGVSGIGANAEATLQQINLDDLLANPRPIMLEIGIGETKPFVTEEMAKRAKETASKYLDLPMNFYIDGNLAWTVDPVDKASFLQFNLDEQKTNLAVNINREAIAVFVNNALVYGINSVPINKKVLVNQDGVEKRVIREGREGVQLLDLDSYVNIIHSAMEKQKAFDANMKVKKTAFDLETTTVDDTRWIEYNISNYCVYLHQRDEIIWSSCATSNGKPPTPTIAGEFWVYQKTPKQCMPNPPSPNPLCDIHYVTYWGAGGYAFHEAWWMTWENGKVNTGLSHGCINMFIDDAKTVYDFAEYGMRVWVHY